MNAARTPQGVDGVLVVYLSDGTRVHLDDIETAALGRTYLDDLDASIDDIEAQIAAATAGAIISADSTWRRRAELALKRKRRMRPRLQERIGVLTRSERQRVAAENAVIRPEGEARRAAFIDAAEQVLDRDLFVEIWDRARAMRPSVFAGRGGAS